MRAIRGRVCERTKGSGERLGLLPQRLWNVPEIWHSYGYPKSGNHELYVGSFRSDLHWEVLSTLGKDPSYRSGRSTALPKSRMQQTCPRSFRRIYTWFDRSCCQISRCQGVKSDWCACLWHQRCLITPCKMKDMNSRSCNGARCSDMQRFTKEKINSLCWNWYQNSFNGMTACCTAIGRNLTSYEPKPLVSLNGCLTVSSFLIHIFFLFLVTVCSTQISLAFVATNLRINLGSQSSLATPRSLQQRIKALDLQPSAEVGIPSGVK